MLEHAKHIVKDMYGLHHHDMDLNSIVDGLSESKTPGKDLQKAIEAQGRKHDLDRIDGGKDHERHDLLLGGKGAPTFDGARRKGALGWFQRKSGLSDQDIDKLKKSWTKNVANQQSPTHTTNDILKGVAKDHPDIHAKIEEWKKKNGPAVLSALRSLSSHDEKDKAKAKGDSPQATKTKRHPHESEMRKKHSLIDDDIDEMKKHKRSLFNPGSPQRMSDRERMQKFLAKCKPETKARMLAPPKMDPADFVKLLGVLTDDEEGGDKAASLRTQLINLAHENASIRSQVLGLLS